MENERCLTLYLNDEELESKGIINFYDFFFFLFSFIMTESDKDNEEKNEELLFWCWIAFS